MNHPAVVQVHCSPFADSSLNECRPSLHADDTDRGRRLGENPQARAAHCAIAVSRLRLSSRHFHNASTTEISSQIGNSKKPSKMKRFQWLAVWLRGQDLNSRHSGYEGDFFAPNGDPHSPRPAIRPSVNFHVSLNFFSARTLNPNAVDAERFAVMRKDCLAWNTEDINHLVTAPAIPYDAGQHRRRGASAAVRTASQVSRLVPLLKSCSACSVPASALHYAVEILRHSNARDLFCVE